MSDISKTNGLKPLSQTSFIDKKAQATDEKFHEVADLYERHFIREMMKQMRSTVHKSDFIKQNNAEKIFQDQLDDQYATQWGKSGGVGLSGIIYDQLMQKYGSQFGLKPKIEKPVGPIDLNSKSNFTGAVMQSASEKNNSTTFKIQTDASQRAELKNPWAGTLLDKK